MAAASARRASVTGSRRMVWSCSPASPLHGLSFAQPAQFDPQQRTRPALLVAQEQGIDRLSVWLGEQHAPERRRVDVDPGH
jgi:hypothetical protein